MRSQRQIAQCFGVMLVLLFANSALAFYDPHVGRFISRDPIGYSDGPNEYQYVKCNPMNGVDPMGLRRTTPEEENVLEELFKLVENAEKSKQDEFAKALKSVISDWQQLIRSVPEGQDPARLAIAGAALRIWGDKPNRVNYTHKGGHWPYKGEYKCAKFVSDVLSKAEIAPIYRHFNPTLIGAGIWANPKIDIGNFKIIYQIRPMGDQKDSILIDTEQPVMGDIEGYSPKGGYGHVGIYLGHRLYISATEADPKKYGDQLGVWIKFEGRDNQDILYRSPDIQWDASLTRMID